MEGSTNQQNPGLTAKVGNVNSERRAKAARRSSRFNAQSLRSGVSPVAVCIHNRKALRAQQAGKPGCHRALGGLVPTASGANSVASALGFRSGATPFGHDHTNTTFRQPSSKPDISIWQRRGHFYLALTSRNVPLVILSPAFFLLR
jgi:hypothetical protein